MGTQPSLEELAEKGRATDARSRQQQSAKQLALVAGRDRKAQRLIDDAFEAPGVSIPAIAAFAVMVVLLLVLRSVVPEGNDHDLITVLGAALPASVVLLVLFRITKQRSRAAQLGWLEALPFAFPREDYLEALATERLRTKVTLTISFAHEVPASDRDTLAAAVGGAVETETRRWERDALLVTSPPLETHFRNSGSDAGSAHNNKNVHRWLRRCVDGGLVAIHARVPIASVAFAATRG